MTGSGKTKLSLRLHSAADHSALSTLTTRLVFRNEELTWPPDSYPVLHPAFPEGKHAVLWESLWGLIPARGHQEGFLEEGASPLSLEGRAGASLVDREEPVSGRGKGMCKARGCKEQGEFGKHGWKGEHAGEAGQVSGPPRQLKVFHWTGSIYGPH